MADFEALIKARLDTSGISGQIKSEIESKAITLDNITVNASKIRSDIEAALSGTFSIDVNPRLSNSSLKNLAQTMTNGLSTQMKLGSNSVASSLSGSLSNALKKQGIIDPKVADAITKSFTDKLGKDANVNLSSIKATVENINDAGAKLKRLNISAFDDLGNKINSTALFKKDGSIDISTDIIQQFAKVTTAAQSTSKNLSESIKFKIDTGAISSSINKVEAQFKRLSNLDFAGMEDIKGHLEDLQKFQDILNPSNTANMSDDDLLANYKSYLKTLATFKNDLTTLQASGTKLANVMDVSSLDNKMQAWLKNNTKATKEYGAAIENLRSQLKAVGLTDAQYKDIYNSYKSIDLEAAAKGLKGKSITEQIKSAATQMFGFVSVGEVINTAVRGLKEMYQAVYDIDTAMINLKKVTDESEQTYSDFLDRSSASAQKLGRSISSLVEQTANWSKLGYSLPEAEELSKLSSIYANVAEVSDDTAVSDIVTAMKAYGLETSEAVRVVDSLNELGNRFATDAASLGQGLSNSASAMNLAGSDLYETLAMITGIAEITQDASGAGNALKISSMRIRGMKGELEELGEEVDANVDSISKVQTQILNLTGGKVNIFDDNKEFRNYYDIMKDIADIYDEMSSTDQASLSEILFGKNRGNQGAALIQAFQSGQIEKAYTTAVESSGSAAEEQARWMESLEAKTQQFQAAWQNLSNSVLNSDFLKGMIDTGTGALNILTGIVDTIGVFGTVASGAGITAFFKNLD